MSLAEIAAHVEVRRRRLAEARKAGDELGRARFEQEIEATLGVVAVDVWGNLLEVRLERTGLRVADPRAVGQKILHAIHAAEAHAAAAMAAHTRRWQ